MLNKVDALYVHVPFCSNICNYCNFTKFLYQEDIVNSYLISLEKELSFYDKNKYSTIYIGGGTPTSLNFFQLNKLLEIINKFKNNNEDFEFTMETNPENLTFEKISLLKKHGVNRISIGVQTSNDKMLKILNRCHKTIDVIHGIERLKKVGINNISIDIMFGLPHQKKEDLLKDLDFFLKLDIPHISFYPLVVEDNTIFKINKVKALSDEKIYEMYNLINKKLSNNGYYRYEVSNFCKKGMESKHNMKYWNDDYYVGIGPGAHGYVDGVRYANSSSITNYIKGEFIKEEKLISKNEQEFEYIMLRLRLKEGIILKDYLSKFGIDFCDKYSSEIEKLKKDGYLEESLESIYVSEKGIYLLNHIIATLTMNLNY
ncbi:MAG: radical SAM family heme chaperone HemW [Bacilli bacterium]|nr:radical SAM family heme chaperone HemW [Bacilli bacterium]